MQGFPADAGVAVRRHDQIGAGRDFRGRDPGIAALMRKRGLPMTATPQVGEKASE